MREKNKRSKNIDRKIVMKDYEKLKKISKACYFFGLYSWSMDIISIAARLMYNFNIIYCDDEFESLLKNISAKITIKNKETILCNKKRVAFYDYFSLDNRGLTEQYLQGLIDNEYEILFITFQKEYEKMHNILKKLELYKKAKIHFVKNNNKNLLCNEIINELIKFQPSKILYHSAPWDTVGYIVLSYFDKSPIDRFLINLTDHAFGLGRDCVDYFIEFRAYGANISLDHRNIDNNRILMLPYYPIQDSEINFLGFPFETEGKRIIFSGGSLYKIYGCSVFFDMVKYILDAYPDTIFYFLGNGSETPLKKYILDNQLENRFFYSKERKDINEVIKRCYFCLNTYPLIGGLMSQLAVANKKIPVTYTDKKYPVNNINELFINNENDEYVFYSLDDVYDEIKKLMENDEYYKQKTNRLKGKLISISEFSRLLFQVIEKKSTSFYNRYNIDLNIFSQVYFDQENHYLHNYENIFFINKNILIFIIFIKYTVKKIINKFIK